MTKRTSGMHEIRRCDGLRKCLRPEQTSLRSPCDKHFPHNYADIEPRTTLKWGLGIYVLFKSSNLLILVVIYSYILFKSPKSQLGSYALPIPKLINVDFLAKRFMHA
jgi:hypothetical protein